MKSTIPLKGYFSLHFGVVAVLPVFTIACLLWLLVMPAMQTRMGVQHQAVARSIAGQISTYLEGGERQLTALAGYLRKQPVYSAAKLEDLLDNQCGNGDFFETLFIIDNKNAAIQSVGLTSTLRPNRADYIGLDLSGRRFIETAKGKTGASWSKTFLSTVSSRMAVALSVPLKDGSIIGEITLAKLSEFIQRLPVESGFLTMVIDSRGQVVADSRNLHWGRVLDLYFSGKKMRQEAAITSAGPFQLDGEEMLGALVEMDTAGWKVLVAQPVHNAFQPLRDTFRLIAYGLVVALALVFPISWLLAGRFTAFFKSYIEIAESIARGQYDLQWPGIKTREFLQMSRALERMAERISRREKELVDGEDRLRNLVANVPGVVYQYKADAESLESAKMTHIVREKVIEIFGLDPEVENFHTAFVNCLPEHDRSRFDSSISEAVKAESPWHYEGPFTKPSGETIWFEGNSVPRRIGGDLIYYGLHADITRRREMESSLRMARFIIDNANVGIYRIRPDGKIDEVNPKAAELLGYTREELESFSIWDIDTLVTPESWEFEHWKTLIEDGKEVLEREHRKKDGAVIQVSVFSNILEYEGQPFAVSFVQDISGRKRMEESLRLTQFIFDKAPIGIWRMGMGGEVLDVNEKGCTSLGYTQEELCRMHVFDFDPTMDRERWATNIGALKEIGNKTLDSLNRRRNGEIFPIQVVENLVHFEDKDILVAFVQDITERKKMEQALKRSEERLDMALESANEGIWDWDLVHDKVYFDSRYYTMAGYEPDAFPGHFEEWEKRVHENDIERVKTLIARHLEGASEIYKAEFRFLRKDGSYMWIKATGKTVAWDERGKPLRFVGTHTDITENKRMSEALEKRILALTRPLEDAENIAFEDLFNLTDIQHLQELYAEAFGVAALITHPDGTPITQPSNFTVLCEEIIRKTKKGCEKCNYSDSMIGRHNPEGPNIMPCLSAGLWNACASISVGGRHIANWLIGQVRNEALDEEEILTYAREIGADENAYRSAYLDVPTLLSR